MFLGYFLLSPMRTAVYPNPARIPKNGISVFASGVSAGCAAGTPCVCSVVGITVGCTVGCTADSDDGCIQMEEPPELLLPPLLFLIGSSWTTANGEQLSTGNSNLR